jgi:hypothetical protein
VVEVLKVFEDADEMLLIADEELKFVGRKQGSLYLKFTQQISLGRGCSLRSHYVALSNRSILEARLVLSQVNDMIFTTRCAAEHPQCPKSR